MSLYFAAADVQEAVQKCFGLLIRPKVNAIEQFGCVRFVAFCGNGIKCINMTTDRMRIDHVLG